MLIGHKYMVWVYAELALKNILKGKEMLKSFGDSGPEYLAHLSTTSSDSPKSHISFKSDTSYLNHLEQLNYLLTQN